MRVFAGMGVPQSIRKTPALFKLRGGDRLRHGAADRVRTKLRIAHFKEIDHKSSGGRMRCPVIVCLRPGRMGKQNTPLRAAKQQPAIAHQTVGDRLVFDRLLERR